MKKLARNWHNSQQNKLSLPTRDDPTFDDFRPMDTQVMYGDWGSMISGALRAISLAALRRIKKNKKSWFGRLKGVKLSRVAYGGSPEKFNFMKTVFAALLCCYILFLLYSIFQQASSPWELKYHAYFIEELYPWMSILADWVAVLACSFAVKGMLHESMHHRRWIWYSWFTGLVLAIFWLYYMFRLPKFRWDVIWLPFGPLGGAAICLYVDHLLAESSEEVKKLRGYIYAYKAS